VQFVKRDTDRVDAERIATELGPTLVTTPSRQFWICRAGHVPVGVQDEAKAAVRVLLARSDPGQLEALAADQRARASLRRARAWAESDIP
jgi:hypothetical protein